jgi:hypothetical protein
MSTLVNTLAHSIMIISGALHTTAVGQEDKGFQQFDWWRAKVCLLSLALDTNGQWTITSRNTMST